MNATIRAIVFDFGGVLVDWNPRYLYRKLFADENAMEAFFDEVGFSEWNVEQDRGGAFTQGVEQHAAKFPHYAEHLRAYDERWRESLAGEFPATVEILRELKDAGYALYGLTNWSAEKFAEVRQEFPFFAWFETIVVSGEVNLIKPDARIFHLLLEQTGRTAEECLFIDDSQKNVNAARTLGFQGIRFESPEQLERELRALNVL